MKNDSIHRNSLPSFDEDEQKDILSSQVWGYPAAIFSERMSNSEIGDCRPVQVAGCRFLILSFPYAVARTGYLDLRALTSR